MKDFGNGWSGLKDYAAKCGVTNADDTDDVAASKIRAVIRDTLPESEVEAYEPTTEGDGNGTERTDTESEAEA